MALKSIFPNAASSVIADKRGFGFHTYSLNSLKDPANPDFLNYVARLAATGPIPSVSDSVVFNLIKQNCDVSLGWKRYTIDESFFVLYDSCVMSLQPSVGSWAPVYSVMIMKYLEALRFFNITEGVTPRIVEHITHVIPSFLDTKGGVFATMFMLAPVAKYFDAFQKAVSDVQKSYINDTRNSRVGIRSAVSAITIAVNRFAEAIDAVRSTLASDQDAIVNSFSWVLSDPENFAKLTISQDAFRYLATFANFWIIDDDQSFAPMQPTLAQEHRITAYADTLRDTLASRLSIYEIQPISALQKLVTLKTIPTLGASPYAATYGLVQWNGVDVIDVAAAVERPFYGTFKSYRSSSALGASLKWITSSYAKVYDIVEKQWLLTFESPYARGTDLVNSTLSTADPYGKKSSDSIIESLAADAAVDLEFDPDAKTFVYTYRCRSVSAPGRDGSFETPDIRMTTSAETVVAHSTKNSSGDVSAFKHPLYLGCALNDKTPVQQLDKIVSQSGSIPSRFVALDASQADGEKIAVAMVDLQFLDLQGNESLHQITVPLASLLDDIDGHGVTKQLEISDVAYANADVLASFISELLASADVTRSLQVAKSIFHSLYLESPTHLRDLIIREARASSLIYEPNVDEFSDRAAKAVIMYNTVRAMASIYISIGFANLGTAVRSLADYLIRNVDSTLALTTR